MCTPAFSSKSRHSGGKGVDTLVILKARYVTRLALVAHLESYVISTAHARILQGARTGEIHGCVPQTSHGSYAFHLLLPLNLRWLGRSDRSCSCSAGLLGSRSVLGFSFFRGEKKSGWNDRNKENMAKTGGNVMEMQVYK